MKKIKFLSIVSLVLLLSISCEQEVIELTPPETETPIENGTPGSANFTKFVAVGNSFVAGVQGGALFTTGQNNSLPAIMATQFAKPGVGGGAFVQPNINASLGWNLFVTQPFLSDNSKPILGRMLLQGASPKPTPQAYAPGNLEALPNPSANPGFIYTGGKATLNNFGVPAIFLGQALIPETGNWAGAGTDPRFNPFYGRLAAPPGGTSTLIGDVAASGGTFFLFWLGLDDYFLHAAFGADPTKAPLTPATGAGAASFDLQYGAAIGALLGSNANLKGVVGNFPDIFKMPHFTAVAYNAVPLDAANAAALNAGFAGYNAALDGLKNPAFGGAYGTTAELDARKVTYIAGNNKPLIADETLLDLGPGFDALQGLGAIDATQRAQLAPFEQVRQTTSTDILPLSAGSVLGTLVGGNPSLINGLSVPLADQYVLIPTEIQAINNARTAYNATVQAIVSANSSKLALADVNAALDGLVAAKVGIYNNVTITPNINPPTGIYSEDGVHLNSRGYALLSRVFIQAINDTFGATVPLTDISKYSATGLPIP
ncbi:MAG: G-D-S-L family lipolytic protein [Bacteroidetes bacterium OLB12]|nr:MAG: G-D-S-L family lipolytic protein [Bacteroidetes bacterium OLB12]HNU42971.1 hypothetical protein [Cyclobacteriaceae bacterium]